MWGVPGGNRSLTTGAAACRTLFRTGCRAEGSKARSAPSELGERGNQPRIAPRAVLRRREGTRLSCPGDDEVGALHGAIRAERAWRARQSNACPRWDSNPYWSGFKPPASAVWATGASYAGRCDPNARLTAAQRDASTRGVAESPPSFTRVSAGSLARSPVAMRSSMTTFASGRKCTGCTAVISPVASSRK
jgi:hypothetical protein